jgi:hypothetical protein
VSELDYKELARAVVDELLSRIAPPAPPATVSRIEPKFLKVTDYAKRAGVSRSTVQAWVKRGMPHAPAPHGARIEVGPADEWLRQGGARAANG